MVDNERASFAFRWAKGLPGRWARNGAILGALMVFAKYGDSQSLTYIFQHPSMLAFFVGSIVVVAGIFALITYLLGLWARWSLSPIDEPNLAAGVRTILRRWVVGALVLGVLMILSDVIFQWRGQRFAVGGTPDAVAENIGHVGGVAIACVAVGLITGYVSRRALKKAIADDTLRLKPNISVPTRNQSQSAEDSSEPPPKNFIIRHWRGGLSLPVSYWVVGFLGNIFIAITVLLLAELVSPRFDFVPLHILAVFVLSWTLLAAMSVWQCVGVWRSATRYRATRAMRNKATFWAGLAQIAVILGIVSLLTSMINQAIPQIIEATKIALLGDPDTPAYQMRLMRDGTEIEITGGMKYGLSDDFQRVIAAAPHLRVVHLNSIGGRIGEAEKLHRIIKEHRFITYTSSSCVSACTIAFIAGRERWLSSGAKLGFHQGAFAGTQFGFAEDLLKSIGASQAFISHTLTTPAISMWYPTMDELIANKIITGVAASDMFAMSGYGPNISEYDLAGQFKTNIPLYNAIARTDPQFFESLMNTLYMSYIDGEPEGKALDKMRQKVLPYIRTRLAFADDATLIDYHKLMVEQYIVLQSIDPKLCFEYAASTSPNTNFSAYFPPALTARELALDERVIKTADPAAHAKPTDAELRPYEATIYRQLLTRFPKATVNVIFKDKIETSDYVPYCNVSIAMFQEIGHLGDPGTATLMRNILSQ